MIDLEIRQDAITDIKAGIKILERAGDITALNLIDEYLHNAQYRVNQNTHILRPDEMYHSNGLPL